MNSASYFEPSETSRLWDTLGRVLERLSTTESDNFGVTIAAPLLPPAQVFLAMPNEPAMLWAASPDCCEVGLGISTQCDGFGPDRLLSIIERAEHALHSFQSVGVGAAAAEPKCFGGFSSAPLNHPSSHWRNFAEAEFTVPRILFRSAANRAAWTLFVSRHEILDALNRQKYIDQLRRLASLSPNVHVAQKVPSLQKRSDNPDRESWARHVALACQLLDAGELEKVVLAREMLLVCSSQPEVAPILERLLGRRDGTVCFALRRGSATFLGATPERLVSRRGSRIVTEALAGSAAANDSVALRKLLSDGKNRLEHSLVVREIVARLNELGAQVDVPQDPELRQFGPLIHLHTSLEARKLAAPHVLLLGERLHPTPAVGGLPVQQALDFIRSHEAFDRGRYASPIGWFDANGDGELAVALRSGLLTGREVRLYAGAGLVQGSEADSEWNETDLKFQSFLDALGLR